MSTGRTNLARRTLAASSITLAMAAWAMLIVASIVVPEASAQRPVLGIAAYVVAACALGVGVVASHRNRQFLAWRIVADAGLILGLVLVVLGVVNLYMYFKDISFV